MSNKTMSTLNIGNNSYEIKDAFARQKIEEMNNTTTEMKDKIDTLWDDCQTVTESVAEAAEMAAQAKKNADHTYSDMLKFLPTDSASGVIASFSDGADNVPVKSLIIDIEPVQDLHGYDSPWPAGGGKNLLNASADTGSSNGVSYTKNEDGTYTVDGTANSTSSFVVGSIELVANTQYILSGCPSGGGGSTYNVRVRDSSYVALGFDAGAEAIITPSETKTYYCQITVVSGTSVSNLVFKPMIRLASVSDSTYAPYSNICPISGWTEAQLNATGKNLFNKDTCQVVDKYFINASGNVVSHNSYAYADTYQPVENNTQYVFSGNIVVSGTYNSVAFYDKDKRFILRFLPASSDVGAAFTTPSDCKFIRWNMRSETYDLSTIQLEKGDTATAYEPFGQSIPISWESEAGTVYGGTLDVLIGLLTVTKGFIQSYNGEALPSSWISDRDVYAQGATPTTGAEVCYDLATPITYQLTPTEVKSLLGKNNIWADCGNVSVKYRADTTTYINRKIAEAIN